MNQRLVLSSGIRVAVRSRGNGGGEQRIPSGEGERFQALLSKEGRRRRVGVGATIAALHQINIDLLLDLQRKARRVYKPANWITGGVPGVIGSARHTDTVCSSDHQY